MPSYVIWVDHQTAKTFRFEKGKAVKENLRTHYVDHHTHQLDHFDRDRNSRKMFEEAAANLKEARRILIVGPGLAKHSFQVYLSEHHPLLFRKIVGCVPMDHAADPRIVDFAERYFEREYQAAEE